MQSKLTYFVSHRNVTVRTDLGHIITFEKGVPTHVPREVHRAAINRGCIPCDEKGKPIDDEVEATAALPADEVVDPMKVPPNYTAEEREEKIREAMDALVERNQSVDFANGTPKGDSISQLVGFKVDQKEARQIWVKRRKELAGETE